MKFIILINYKNKTIISIDTGKKTFKKILTLLIIKTFKLTKIEKYPLKPVWAGKITVNKVHGLHS